MTVKERAEKGSEYKAKGTYNCTRSVLAAFDDIINVDADELTTKTAGFAAGMGNMEGTCGALIGAIMVAGILTDGKGTPKYSRLIVDKFKELSGATICRDLKGVSTGNMLTSCPDCVRNAILALGHAFETEEI